jgi:hypothetical protein
MAYCTVCGGETTAPVIATGWMARGLMALGILPTKTEEDEFGNIEHTVETSVHTTCRCSINRSPSNKRKDDPLNESEFTRF